jgi:predicted membrane-bound spermidine synthase
MQYLLYAVFILSGAAGLIYESIWSRYLGLFVGHSAYAQIIVLTIFLGGMSLGAWGAGRRSERLKQPLIAYAFIELAIGAIGLVFHDVFITTTAIAYDSIFPHLAGSPLLLTVVKWSIASALILPQSVLLGTTFPLMSAGVLRLIRDRPGRVLSLLYFANSLGASGGVLFAGFYLLRAVGLPGTLLAAALINGLVFLVTFIAVRAKGMLDARAGGAGKATAPAAPALAPPSKSAYPMLLAAPALSRLLLIVAFGTAVASFVYEISWIRMLSLVLGSATHSFDLMLSAFILGLALGALWVHGRADRFRDPLRALGIVQWLMGFAAMATIPFYLMSFGWTSLLIGALARSDGGYLLFGIARYAFCIIVMLPATFFAGITLPVITKLLLDAGRGERAVGTVYAVNTLGSIVGVILAGLILMPLIGLKVLLICGAVLDMSLGVYLLFIAAGAAPRARRLMFASAAGLVVVAVATIALNDFNQVVLSSGVFRNGILPDPASRSIIYYRDGRTATVSVGQATRDKSIFISSNGKPDGSLDTAWYRYDPKAPRRYIGDDISTQVFLPLITLAHAPRAVTGAVIGQGTGITSHLLLGSPYLKSLTTIEIEPAMIEGSRLFKPANRRAFDDPRSHFAIDDAKSFFATNNTAFDLIVSEPSNPWVSGVSGLFTTEFYARVRRYLTPDGVFGQWLHLYEIDDGLVMSVLSAIDQNFASYQIFMISDTDILIVASNRSTLPAPDWGVFDYPMIAEDLRPAMRFTPAGLEATRMAGRASLSPMLARFSTPNSDFLPVLDLGAERTRFMHLGADGFAALNSDRFDIISELSGRRVPFDTATTTPVPTIRRNHALAVGAILHRRRVADAQDSLSGLDVSPALRRRARLENEMASGRPPADWRIWAVDAQVVERELHGGTAGVVDEDFYRELFAYIASQRGPAGALQAFAFLRAVSRYDWPAASALADSLTAGPGPGWLNVNELRDGGTVAKLAVGDVDGARAYWVRLGPQATRPPNSVRSLLIVSYIASGARAEKSRRERTRGGVPR